MKPSTWGAFPANCKLHPVFRAQIKFHLFHGGSLVVPPRWQLLCLLNALPTEYIQPHTITVMLRAASPSGRAYLFVSSSASVQGLAHSRSSERHLLKHTGDAHNLSSSSSIMSPIPWLSGPRSRICSHSCWPSMYFSSILFHFSLDTTYFGHLFSCLNKPLEDSVAQNSSHFVLCLLMTVIWAGLIWAVLVLLVITHVATFSWQAGWDTSFSRSSVSLGVAPFPCRL